MGFASLDQVVNAVSVEGRGQTLLFTTRLTGNTVVNTPHSNWFSTGNPSAGAVPTTGLAGAVACTSSTAGAMPYTNPSGGRTMHIVSVSISALISGTGTFMLIDRIAHANILASQGTGNFSPVIDATPRLDSGEGAMLFLEVNTTFGGANHTRSFTYTNQDGTGSRTTASVVCVASAVGGRMPYADFIWIPLQSGDIGVRSVEATTLVTGSTTGDMNVVLARPLFPPIPLSGVGGSGDRELVVEIPSLPQIKDDSCLQWIFIPTLASLYPLCGDIRIAEN